MNEYTFCWPISKEKGPPTNVDDGKHRSGFGFSGSSLQRHLSFIWHCCWTPLISRSIENAS